MTIQNEKDIGAEIRSIRAKKGETQKKVAREIGVSIHQLYKYERGLDKVSVSRLHKIAVALEVSILDLLPSYFKGENE